MERHRGRIQPKKKEPIQKQPPPKLVFGVHRPCLWCKGIGKRPKRKELCGACGGTGYYAPEPKPDE